MSRWDHPVCVACWNERNFTPPAIVVARLAESAVPCCYCTEPTGAGLILYADPADMPCAGNHFDEGGEA